MTIQEEIFFPIHELSTYQAALFESILAPTHHLHEYITWTVEPCSCTLANLRNMLFGVAISAQVVF